MKENGKKMGRPISGDEPKDRRISLRATKTTVELFDKCVQATGKQKTDLLEMMIEELYKKVCE